MNYPFEFNELLLTEKVIQYMGFNNWWGDSGDGYEIAFGKENDPTSVVNYRLRATCEESEPYSYSTSYYQTQHIMNDKFEPLYFIHELYEDIVKNASVKDFNILITHFKKLSVYPYIQSYLKYKEEDK